MVGTPLRDRYPVAVALALIGLCPFILLSTAVTVLQATLLRTLDATSGQLELSNALANAGYAFGAVMAAGLIKNFTLRHLYTVAEAIFLVGCLLDAAASSATPYVAGRTLQGLGTGLLLVIALPPLLTRFEASKVPLSAAITDIGLFGAATAGPIVAAGVAAAGSPAALEIGFAVVALAGIVLAQLGIDRELGRFDRSERVIQLPVFLALAATVLPFLASAMLPQLPFSAALYLGLTVGGIAALFALVGGQFRKSKPLMPVRLLATTLPVVGTLCAMIGGAAFVALDVISQTMLLDVRHESQLAAGLSYWPQVLGVAVAAILFAKLFNTRFVAVLALGGLLAIAGAGTVLVVANPVHPSNAATLGLSAFLLGLGAGAAVAPGLFLVGLGAPSRQIGPAFALVELLRSEAAFIAAPVLLDVATGGVVPPGTLGAPAGVGDTGWAIVAFVGVGIVALSAIFFGSGARLRAPDLEEWIDEGGQALESPPVAEPLRKSA